jgi:hypothetical protein
MGWMQSLNPKLKSTQRKNISNNDFAVAQRERHTRAKHSSTRKPKNSGTRAQKIAVHESKN